MIQSKKFTVGIKYIPFWGVFIIGIFFHKGAIAQTTLNGEREITISSRQEINGKLEQIDTVVFSNNLLQLYKEVGIDSFRINEEKMTFFLSHSLQGRKQLLGLYEFAGKDYNELNQQEKEKVKEALQTAKIPLPADNYREINPQINLQDGDSAILTSVVSPSTTTPLIHIQIPDSAHASMPIEIVLSGSNPPQKFTIDSLGNRNLIMDIENLSEEEKKYLTISFQQSGLEDVLGKMDIGLAVKDPQFNIPAAGSLKTTIEIQQASTATARTLYSFGLNPKNNLTLQEFIFTPLNDKGKWLLAFRSPTIGKLSIHIFDQKGRWVYQEERSNFRGSLKKGIDFTKRITGEYILYIEHGSKGMIKELRLK